MMKANEFDLWSETYDSDVAISDKSNKYPFSGYGKVLSYIYNQVNRKIPSHVLDIGFGTATLTEKLYLKGHHISGVDFAQEMVDIAREKMPKARIYRYDVVYDFPEEISMQSLDFIISTYAFHHFDENQKKLILQRLLRLLEPDGIILIGDVAFFSETEMNECEVTNLDSWDYEEKYIVYEQMCTHFPQSKFQKISSCAGVLSISK